MIEALVDDRPVPGAGLSDLNFFMQIGASLWGARSLPGL